LTGSGFGGALTGSVSGVAGRTGAGRSVSRMGFPMSPTAAWDATRVNDEIPPEEDLPEQEPERGDIREDITKQLALLFPHDRLERIAERLRLQDEEDLQFVIDLISATFTRGIEFGAVEVTAQQIELGQQTAPATIEIAHVELP
jgi:hypothetical protein